MKKAFTLIELLVVIAIIAILAALLMPALARARQEAEKTKCRANVHNIGLAMTMKIGDQDGLYPGWVEDWIGRIPVGREGVLGVFDKEAQPTNGSPFYQLLKGGYIDDIDLWDCPTAENPSWYDWHGPELIDVDYDDPHDWDWPPAEPTGISGIGWHSGQHKILRFAEYAYDLGRISRNSVAGRVIYGDAWARCHNWGDVAWGWWNYNHAEGSNLLYV
ncbi:MAG: prepilin-type N-terminal cleavage/methylation domain-containing protein, partial [Planctomycetota bacterium]